MRRQVELRLWKLIHASRKFLELSENKSKKTLWEFMDRSTSTGLLKRNGRRVMSSSQPNRAWRSKMAPLCKVISWMRHSTRGTKPFSSSWFTIPKRIQRWRTLESNRKRLQGSWMTFLAKSLTRKTWEHSLRMKLFRLCGGPKKVHLSLASRQVQSLKRFSTRHRSWRDRRS